RAADQADEEEPGGPGTFGRNYPPHRGSRSVLPRNCEAGRADPLEPRGRCGVATSPTDQGRGRQGRSRPDARATGRVPPSGPVRALADVPLPRRYGPALVGADRTPLA